MTEPVAMDARDRTTGRPRVLVACVGNALRGDDGFGPAVLAALLDANALPADVHAVDVGIGGMALVHELLAGWDALIVVDAVDRGAAPGSLHVLEPTVPELDTVSLADRRAVAADMHRMTPSRVLLLARAVGALPDVVRIVGCQPASTEELDPELSGVVRAAVPAAVDTIRTLVQALTGPAHRQRVDLT